MAAYVTPTAPDRPRATDTFTKRRGTRGEGGGVLCLWRLLPPPVAELKASSEQLVGRSICWCSLVMGRLVIGRLLTRTLTCQFVQVFA